MKEKMIALAISIATLIILIVVFTTGANDPNIKIEDDTLYIDCYYGTAIPLSSIKTVTLDERSLGEIAPSWQKTNGYNGVTGDLRGYFKAPDIGTVLLYVMSDSKPTIIIEREKQRDIYISCKSAQTTQEYYNTIISKL